MKIPFELAETIPFNLPAENPTDEQVRTAMLADLDDILISEEGDQWGDRSKGTRLNEMLEQTGGADVVDQVQVEVARELVREAPYMHALPGPAGIVPRTGKVTAQFTVRLSDRPSAAVEHTVGEQLAEQQTEEA